MSFNEWNEVKLGELIDSISVRHKFDKEELIFLNTSDILEGKILHNDYSDVKSMPGQAKKSIAKGDILFSEIRPKNKRFAYVDFDGDDFVVSTKLMVLRKKSDDIDNIFLYKYLTSEDTLNYLQTIAEGRSGTFPQITFSELKSIDIKLPPIEEQKAIAKILSDLDDKIEVNNKINKNLEEMAQAIFKHWFVDFEFPNEEGKPYKSSGGEMVESELGMIPKGWEVKKLSEVFTFKKGKKPKEILEKKENEDYKKYLTIDVLNQNSELFALPEKLVECLNDETLMVMDGASSGTIYTGMSGIVGSTLAKLEAKDNSYKTFIFNFLKYREFDIKSHLTGSAIPHADKNYINAIKVALPKEKEVLLNLSNTLRLIMEKIRINKLENKKLNALRDVLLPKLMSGEIRVAFK